MRDAPIEVASARRRRHLEHGVVEPDGAAAGEHDADLDRLRRARNLDDDFAAHPLRSFRRSRRPRSSRSPPASRRRSPAGAVSPPCRRRWRRRRPSGARRKSAASCRCAAPRNALRDAAVDLRPQVPDAHAWLRRSASSTRSMRERSTPAARHADARPSPPRCRRCRSRFDSNPGFG